MTEKTDEEINTLEQVAHLVSLKLSLIDKYIKAGDLETIWLWDQQLVLHSQLGDFLIRRLKMFQAKKPKVPEETASKSQKIDKKTQPIEKPKKIQVKTSFSTNLIENAHEDLIVSIDICTESNLIVTGSRDTTLRIWNLQGVKLHSFGGKRPALENM